MKRPGAWAGSKDLVLRSVRGHQLSSTKRTPAEHAAQGGHEDSDHLTTKETAFAADVPVRNSNQGKRIAKEAARRLGVSWKFNTNHTYPSMKHRGYYVQIVHGPKVDHANHVHVGVEFIGV